MKLDTECETLQYVPVCASESPWLQLPTALQGPVRTDNGDDSDNTLAIVITAVATCVATALAVGFLAFVIAAVHHSMYKKRTQKAVPVSVHNEYELKT